MQEIDDSGYVNAYVMSLKYPQSFEAPTKEELDNLKIGDTVKVCRNGERYWVTITNIEGDTIYADLDNFLIFPDDESENPVFKKHNIFQIYDN